MDIKKIKNNLMILSRTKVVLKKKTIFAAG